jgi:4-alpha-glucanotransferase
MQDILGLDDEARLNMPGSTGSNWLWRMTKEALSPEIEHMLREMVQLYNRS